MKWLEKIVRKIVNEERKERAIQKERLQKEYNKKVKDSTYVLDFDGITTRYDLIEVLRLLDNNGMKFILTEEEVTKFESVIKKKT